MSKLSHTSIQAFKSCRRLYQLRYVEGLCPSTTASPLERGTSYHAQVEAILKGEPPEPCTPKVGGMVAAFQRYILPRLGEVQSVEQWFEKPIGTASTIVGRCDGLAKTGSVIEHKTTSAPIDGDYLAALENDEQILTYMWAYATNNMIYTVCRTPTIRQRSSETEEEFRKRCEEWYETDTEQKVAVFELYRTPEEISAFEKELGRMADEIKGTNFFYRVPSHCHKWGRMCEYAPICRNYDPNQNYIGFERRKAT